MMMKKETPSQRAWISELGRTSHQHRPSKAKPSSTSHEAPPFLYAYHQIQDIWIGPGPIQFSLIYTAAKPQGAFY